MQDSQQNPKPDLLVAEISRYMDLGLSMFPCKPGLKKPATEHGFKDATTERQQLEKYFADPFMNIGIPTGSVSGAWVLDIDSYKGGTQSLAELMDGIELPATWMARTGRGGIHYWFAMPEGKVKTTADILPGIDVRGDGGYVVVPPSRVPEGSYEWLAAPWDVDLAPAPAELMERLERAHQLRKPEGDPSSSTAGRGFDIESALQGVPEGQRDDTLFRLACRLRADNVGMDSAITMLEMAARNCNPPFDARIARAKVEWVYRKFQPGWSDEAKRRVQEGIGYTPEGTFESAERHNVQLVSEPEDQPEEEPKEHPRTDLGNAERLAAKIRGKAVWCHMWKSWLLWDGKRWQKDDTGGAPIIRAAIETVRGIVDEAKDSDTLKWAAKSQERRLINAMVELSKALPGIPVVPSAFDTEDWLLNLPNGTLDLRTGELRSHKREDMITRMGSAPYDPDADIEQWINFLDRVTGGSRDLQMFLCRAAGYSLTGSTREQSLMFLYGSGRNGKSTFMDLLMHVMGDYAMHTPTETLMVKRENPGVPNDLARLKGARLVAATETEAGKRLAESLVKQLTGGDPITARYLHAEFFTFTPTFKLWLSGNHKPAIRGADEGIWRRIRLVPFDVRIPQSEADPDLKDKLKEGAAGVLAWMVAGCLDWQKNRMEAPKAVEEATTGYRREMDTIGEFIEECIEAAPHEFLPSGQVYKAYRTWCEEHGEHVRTQKALSQEMVDRGFTLGQGTGGVRGFRGLRLADGAGAGQDRRMPYAD